MKNKNSVFWYINSKYMWFVRIAWLLVFAGVSYYIYIRLNQETLSRRGIVYYKGELNHFLRAIVFSPLAVIALWFGSFGTRAKKNTT